MKTIAITLLLVSLTGMAIFAEGAQEEQTWEPGMGRGYISDDQTNRGSGFKGNGYVDQSYGRSMPMNNNYPGQNFQGRPPMSIKGRPVQNNGSGGPAGMGYNNPNMDVENISLTGTIDLTDANLPKLTVGDDTYQLMVPYRLDYDIDIADGDEITISGYEVPAYRRTSDSDLTSLMVTAANYNGTEYNLNMMDNGPMGYGQRAPEMNNYGPANGYHGKPGRYNNSRFYNNREDWRHQPQGMMQRPYGRR